MDDPHALHRLAALDDRLARTPAGSPGLQLATSIVLPGLPAIRRRPFVGSLLFLVGVIGPIALVVWAFQNRDDVIGFALDPSFLNTVVVAGLGLVLVRFLAVAEVAHAFRRSRAIAPKTVVATLLVLALALPVLWVTRQAADTRAMVANVFASGSEDPLYTPEAWTNHVTNVLLLGGDAGPGRWGMRTDTMIVASIDDATGRTALVSVPRNLVRLRFPPGTPMADEFPDGFTAYDGLTNAIFTYVNGRDDLIAAYGGGGLQAEAVALSDGIGYSLGIQIDDYALVNMQGFADLVDAVGGVTLDVPKAVPLPPVAGCDVPATLNAGTVDMDGCLAIAYVRSRHADSDYQRMQRQRQLLAALGSQVSAREAVAGFGSATSALDDSVRTSLTPGEFSNLLDRLGDSSAIGESVGLAPPLIEPGHPDYDQIKQIMDAVEDYVRTGTPSGYAS